MEDPLVRDRPAGGGRPVPGRCHGDTQPGDTRTRRDRAGLEAVGGLRGRDHASAEPTRKVTRRRAATVPDGSDSAPTLRRDGTEARRRRNAAIPGRPPYR
ncbi:protein of unknown function [Streptomyces murinus]